MTKRLLALAMVFCLAFPQQGQSMHKKKKSKSATNQTTQTLEGTWELTYIEGGEFSKLYKGKIPQITFDLKKNSVNGNNGCNSFFGIAHIAGNKIGFDGLGSTKMFCPGDGERLFMDALAKISTYAISAPGEVDFISGDIGLMHFKKIK